MSEYATVLHLHKLALSLPLGPEYEYPGIRGSIVNSPLVHVAPRNATTVHGFWPRVLNVHPNAEIVQSGALIWAAAKLEKKYNVPSAAR